MHSDAERSALRDIEYNIILAEHFCLGRDIQRFNDDVMRVYAVTRCLEIISEASRRLSAVLKERHPNIAWREMAGAGNIYRHDYEERGSETRLGDGATGAAAAQNRRRAGAQGIGGACQSRATLTGWRLAADSTIASKAATAWSTWSGGIG
jgi:uncharacterized protein with HEPN domain